MKVKGRQCVEANRLGGKFVTWKRKRRVRRMSSSFKGKHEAVYWNPNNISLMGGLENDI